MNKTFKMIALFVTLFLTVAGTVLVINQTIQFSTFMDTFHPIAGEITFWTLISLYLIFLSVPLVLYLRLPKRLELPASENSEEFETYLHSVGNRLSQNSSLESSSFKSRDEIEKGLEELDKGCLELVKRAGSKTFLFTAISQFGALDTLMVLGTQTKLIWDVAHLYNQRPTLRDMWYLYSNVITTAFITGELNDVDFAEIIQPVISKTLGSAGTAIPGTSLFINSLFTGTSNAFLMLRVGLITRNYCNSLVEQKRSFIRRSAITESVALLSVITMEGGKKLSEAILKSAGKTVTDTVSAAGKTVTDTVSNAGNSIVSAGKKIIGSFTI